MKTLIALSLILSTSAFAIDTKNCPGRIAVKLGGFKVTRTPDQVIKAMDGGFGLIDQLQAEGIKYSMKVLRMNEGVNEYFTLKQASNGKCVYLNSSAKDSQQKAEIYTSQGVNRMYVQSQIGPRGIMLRTYFQVLSVRPDQVQLTETPAVLALAVPRSPYTSYDAGGPLANVGQAMNFGIEAHAKK